MRPVHRLSLSGVLPVLHATLIVALFVLLWRSAVPWTWAVGLFSVLGAPLLVAAVGLVRRDSYTYQWLAILLVIYIGGAAVEVVATRGRVLVASIVLLAAALELGVLLVLIRARRLRAASERTVS